MILSDAIKQIQHTLDGDPAPELSARRLVNEAGDFLCRMHPWKWLERGSVTLAAVADQSFIELPSDLASITSIKMDDSSVSLRDFRFTTHDEILQLRQNPIEATGGYFGVVVYELASGSTEGPLKPRLELYPTPNANDASFLRLGYRAGWQRVVDDDDPLRIPHWIESLYNQILRAWARGYEEEDTAALDTRLEVIARGRIFQQAIQSDGRIQPDYGVLNTVNGRIRRVQFYTGNVNNPS